MLKLGTQNIPALYLGGEQIKKAYLGEAEVFGAGTPSRLPEGYTEVEYIQSSGTQYIDTGVKPTSNIRLAIDVHPLSTAASTSKFIAQSYARVGSNAYFLNLFLPTGGGIQVTTGAGTGTGGMLTTNALQKVYISIDYSSKKASIEGEKAVTISNATYSTMPTVKLLSGSSGNYLCDAKLYSCQIEIGGEATRDFIPCVGPSGAVGLYDLVEGKFYGNAGTGEFTAGPAV